MPIIALAAKAVTISVSSCKSPATAARAARFRGAATPGVSSIRFGFHIRISVRFGSSALRCVRDQQFRNPDQKAYTASPNNPFYIATYSYSLFLQNRKDEALKVVSNVSRKQLEIPAVAAYFGIIQANFGHIDVAREPLQRAEAATLLPEEKEIVRQALAKL